MILKIGITQKLRKNPFFCPDKKSIKLWEKYLLAIRKSGSSCGAVIELRATGIPVGLGAPIYSKLDTDIAAALNEYKCSKRCQYWIWYEFSFFKWRRKLR